MSVHASNAARAPVVWAATAGEAGTRAQALGLAHAVASEVVERVVELAWPWRHLRPDLVPFALSALARAGDRLEPPWPDLLVTCGRRAAAASIAVRRASRGRTATVHIGDPRAPAEAFDLVFPMAHDRLRGANVVPLLTSLHGLDPLRIALAGETWRARLSHLPRPLTGVLIGGPVRGRGFGKPQALELVRRLRDETRAVVATFSRRTPDVVRDIVSAALAGRPDAWLWDGLGGNPYPGMLGLCDEVVVTSDSVSMISEALATDRPVRVFDLGLGGRHGRFLESLRAEGLVGRLGGEAAPASRRRVDATAFAARRVLGLLQARGHSVAEVDLPQRSNRRGL